MLQLLALLRLTMNFPLVFFLSLSCFFLSCLARTFPCVVRYSIEKLESSWQNKSTCREWNTHVSGKEGQDDTHTHTHTHTHTLTLIFSTCEAFIPMKRHNLL